MAKEIESVLESSSNSNEVSGKASWETTHYKEKYAYKLGELEVYPVKPWEVALGSVLKFRPFSEIVKLDENELMPCGQHEDMEEMFKDFELTVTADILKNIEYNRNYIVCIEKNGEKNWLSLAMFNSIIGGVKTEEEEAVEEELPKIYSIKVSADKKDEAIIQEMMDKVDKKRFKKLLSIGASYEHDGIRCVVSDEIMNTYLRRWAETKYEFYLLFGKTLTRKMDVELDINKDEMNLLIKELVVKFPQYGIYTQSIDTSSYISNTLNDINSSYFRYGEQFYRRGMKVSKFFSSFLQDKNFDIELSKLMQNKKTKGSIFLSIDPYDILTCSVNSHDWRSCFRIHDGEWATGAFSYLIDETTIIAYRANEGQEFDYSLNKFKFKGNSKTWRQFVHIDKGSCGVIFSRQYPSENAMLAKEVRGFLEDIISEYVGLGVNASWKIYSSRIDGGYEDMSSLHYSDLENGCSFKMVRLSESREGIANFKNGSEIWCAKCGRFEEVVKGEVILCPSCFDNLK